MRSSSSKSKKHNIYDSLNTILHKVPFLKLAYESGFIKRKSQKLNPEIFITAFMLMINNGKITFSKWADQVCLLNGHKVSKQAIHKKVTVNFVTYCRNIVKFLMTNIILEDYAKIKDSLIAKFKNIYIQDSTTLKLPRHLSWCYPGTVSKGEITSQIKIQTIYDLKSGLFNFFKLTSFRVNDQACTEDIISKSNKNDLIIRDLGYFVLKSFKTLTDKGIYFISKLKYGIYIFDFQSEKIIDIVKLMKHRDKLDTWVIIGKEEKLKARIVITRIHPEIARIRKQKSKNDRHADANHSKEYFRLLEYSILITNIKKEEISLDQVFELYSLRWRIEIIFKSWKSYNNLQKLLPESPSLGKEKAESIILLSLLNIILQNNLYQVAVRHNDQFNNNKYISLFKFIDFYNNHLGLLIRSVKIDFDQILAVCYYEDRKDRRNYYERLAS